MKASENNNWLDDALAKAIGSEKRMPDFAKWQQEHPEVLQILKSQATRQTQPRSPLEIGRIIMKSPITKLAAAAVIIVAVVISITVFNKSMPAAFGIEQVIDAYDNVHFLHVKEFWASRQKPDEFWIKSDEQGRVVKARYYLPVTEDGVKLITWTPGKLEIWFKSKHRFLICQIKQIESWMQSILEQCQPKLVMQKLLEDQKAGKVDVDIQKPQDKQEPAVIVATYKTEPKKEVYYIDQATDLITHRECYQIEDNREVLISKTEFCDYNVPIDEKIFSLRDEVPKDVRIADQLNQICGVPQGNMTDEQAAAETVRQFFQALIDKDYKKAGLIYGGELEEYAKEEFGGINVTKIISICPPIPQPDWDERGFRVLCVLEIITSDGDKASWKPGPYVRPGDDERYPDRWNITGGIDVTSDIWSLAGGKDAKLEYKILPDNEKYEKMTPKEAAEAMSKACSEKNLDEFLKFWSLSDTDERTEQIKKYFGGLEIVSIGEPFKSGEYPGWFIPYEIRLRSAQKERCLRLSNANSAGRFVITGWCDCNLQNQKELKWPNEPEVLPDNNVYAKMSPDEAARAFNEAFSKPDFNEMRKFAPDYFVEPRKQNFEEMRKKPPGFEIIGDAFWSAEHSAYFVKCRLFKRGEVKKWNLAIRNDNPAKRWFIDGGI